MKNLLIIAFLLVAANSYCQSDSVSFTYCEIVGNLKFASTKISIQIDYGNEAGYKDKRLKDENGKVQSFNTMVDALNYMGTMGWEFVQAYTITIGGQNVYHYIMKRKLIK